MDGHIANYGSRLMTTYLPREGMDDGGGKGRQILYLEHGAENGGIEPRREEEDEKEDYLFLRAFVRGVDGDGMAWHGSQGGCGSAKEGQGSQGEEDLVSV